MKVLFLLLLIFSGRSSHLHNLASELGQKITALDALGSHQYKTLTLIWFEISGGQVKGEACCVYLQVSWLALTQSHFQHNIFHLLWHDWKMGKKTCWWWWLQTSFLLAFNISFKGYYGKIGMQMMHVYKYKCKINKL